ncbi:tRNA A37 threonylcarbamoyladenosine synthetase [Emydomyces testavorans]|uniref:Threonylcarbamoyl-AMP synthase n=1 Tax=Emydomyces testavorans TaxID=2070801 RepID=A0AAF0DI93_9EURO|nr:tRNA A37 threonylcarbamoyladenosine synthetase [Emydomyces testavorans]
MASIALEQHETNGQNARETRILSVHSLNLPTLSEAEIQRRWDAAKETGSAEAQALLRAAEALRTSDVPVAFPTETVYGLGADATRSAAVLGIFKAKQRPSDNPLIVHVSSREQLERLLQPPKCSVLKQNGSRIRSLIPSIYEPLIERFWPGPLTIIIPNPNHRPLAPEVTAGLCTFGVRMPSSPLARLLIQLADRPLAAPSANASTKPSPTTAQHVYTDLQGRIDIILDGGPCGVGVESTVVDGLSQPPAILRPGGVGIEEIRACPGWENVHVGYKDGALQSKTAPRAPGMKYRHYSPKAKVVLFETGQDMLSIKGRILHEQMTSNPPKIGVIRTKLWQKGLTMPIQQDIDLSISMNGTNGHTDERFSSKLLDDSAPLSALPIHRLSIHTSASESSCPQSTIDMLDISLGPDTQSIARGLFSALRSLDENQVSVIFIEGISDTEGDLAAAIMNRLRKAAEEDIRS